jgi:hypothetical protein
MNNEQSFVIAFHNDEDKHPYLGLTCKDRAIRTIKPYIPGDILTSLRNLKDKTEFDEMRVKMSLEAGIAMHDERVLNFVLRKVTEGESIFLDLTLADAEKHNESGFASSHFVIASVLCLSDKWFDLVNTEKFTREDKDRILSIVHESQGLPIEQELSVV